MSFMVAAAPSSIKTNFSYFSFTVAAAAVAVTVAGIHSVFCFISFYKLISQLGFLAVR